MTRLNKLISITTLVLFILACNFVTQPVRDVQNVAETAQSIASALPVETIQALASQVASQVPVETLQALPSALPEIGNFFNPQGTPVAEWNGIPIMSQATAGQEHDSSNYSFKATVTVQEAKDFYDAEMIKLGWAQMLSMPGDTEGALLVFSKDSSVVTITITNVDGSTVVLLSRA